MVIACAPPVSQNLSATSATTICAGETISFEVDVTENLIVYELINQNGFAVGPASLGDGSALSLTSFAMGDTTTAVSVRAQKIGIDCKDDFGSVPVSVESLGISHAITQHPVNCLTPDGIITISGAGLNNNQSYTVDYILDGNAVNTSTTSNGSGQILLSGLSPGDYSNIAVTGTAITLICNNIIAGPVSLINSNSPILTLPVGTGTTTCGGADGSISLTSSGLGESYTINFSKDGVGGSATVNSDGTTGAISDFNGLSAGIYTNINIINAAGCKSNNVGPIILSDPNPTIAVSASSNPTGELLQELL